MDHQRFDQLSRRFAAQRTRRQAIKALAGAVVGVLAGSRAATAQTCVPQYSPCSGDADCCAGAVCEYGMCMPGCRVDGVFHHAWTSPPENICGQCQPEVSTTSLVPVNEGMACWSGDPNAGFTTCQGGVCRGEAPQSCPPPTPCFLEGEVDPVTGLCVNPPAPEGTPCGVEAMCYGGFYQPADMCDGNGFCIGGGSRTVSCDPYECGTDACLTSCTSDADCADGAYCTSDGTCEPVPVCGSVSGQITDASTGDGIPGAEVTVDGQTEITDDLGYYEFSCVEAGDQTVEASADGFGSGSTTVTVVAGEAVTANISLPPLSTAEIITLVLTWNATPYDLDSHMSGPDVENGGRFHIAYYNMAPVSYASLDVDDVTGNGPETVTVIKSSGGAFVSGEYRYWVHNYSRTPEYDVSGATLTVYKDSVQVLQYQVSGATGNPADDIWHVFDFQLAANGTITPTAIQTIQPGDESTVL